MKITRINPFLVDRYLLVRVYTDEGIVGNGEADLWAHHQMVYHLIRELGDYYVGMLLDADDDVVEADEGNNTGHDESPVTVN